MDDSHDRGNRNGGIAGYDRGQASPRADPLNAVR